MNATTLVEGLALRDEIAWLRHDRDRLVEELALERARAADAEHQACTDVLTGLGNRLALLAELASRAGRGERYGLLLLDLDKFKQVNDMFGHAAGDVVLVEVAGVLAASTPAGGFAARLGGDEFVLVVAEPAAALPLADEVRAALPVGASIGVAYAEPGMAPGEVLGRADAAMYWAKARRGAVVEYRPLPGFTGPPPAPEPAPSGQQRVRLRDMRRLDELVDTALYQEVGR